MTKSGGAGVAPRPEEAIHSMAEIVSKVPGEVVFCTGIDARGRVTESECFASESADRNSLPLEHLFFLPRRLGSSSVLFVSKASGPLDVLHERDAEFTRAVYDYGREVGIPLWDHVLVEEGAVRSMKEWMNLG